MDFHISYYYILILLIVCPKCSFSQKPAIDSNKHLPICSGYTDTRTINVTVSNTSHLIIIPENRTSRVASQNSLVTGPIIFQKEANVHLKCDENKAELRKISLEFELEPLHSLSKGRNFQTVDNASTNPHVHSYFTTSGYFYDNVTSNFYKPNGDYCVASYSDHDITLKICGSSDDCSSSSTSHSWCLPKCCAADEVLLYWKRQCVRVTETDGVTPWIPAIFQGPDHPHQELPTSGVSDNLIFHMASFPHNCNVLKFANGTQRRGSLYKRFSASATTHPKSNETHGKDLVKLVAPAGGKNGKIQPMGFFRPSRKWKIMENWAHFCVEGFHVKTDDTPTYSGKVDDFVIFYCDDDHENDSFHSSAKSWIYSFTSLLALCFLFATMIIYMILWEKQNVHGLTILSYTVTTFGGNLFLLAAHLVYFLSAAGQDYIGLFRRGPICYGIAVLAHYFVLSSYSWLTIMNLDLWLTFSSVRSVKKNAKEWRKFGAYCIAAWVVPILLVIAFVIVDIVYREPTTEVPVPDYATSTCFVSPEFRGEYVYTPMAILLGINTILIFLTMKIFLEARCQMSKAFSGSMTNQYSAKLFCKLFIVMGGTSLVDFCTWYYNAKVKPWPIVVLESVNYLLTPFILFVLFCLNNRTVSQLREKFPALMDKLQPVLKVIVRLDGRPEHSRSGSARKTSIRTLGRHDSGTESISMKTVTLSSNAC